MKRDICVDLDGVLAAYDGWKGIDHIGDPIPGAREFLAALRKDYNVVIFTTRCNPEVNGRSGEGPDLLARRVEDWLKKHDMPFDHVWRGVGKPIAAHYVDDNAIRCEPQLGKDFVLAQVSYETTLAYIRDKTKEHRERAEARKAQTQ